MKKIIALSAGLLLTALAGPAFPDDLPGPLRAPLTALAGVMRQPKSAWTAEDLAQFHAARAQMDAVLTRDLNDPMADQWFRHRFNEGTWLTYDPATQYLIARHEPLAIDQAYQFRTFVNYMINMEMEIYGPDSAGSCLSTKALRLLKNGAGTPAEDAYLNAVRVGAASMLLMMPHESYRRAVELDPAFAAMAGKDLDREQQDTIASIMGGELMAAAFTGDSIAAVSKQEDNWYDSFTGEAYPKAWIDQATARLAATDYPDALDKARPVFDLINAQRGNGPEAVLAALCD